MNHFVKQLKADLRRLPILIFGFLFLALGIMLTRRSALGMSPWGVFHDGLSLQTGLTFGVITQLVGLIIMVLSVILLKTKIGLGTILNVACVGLLIDWFDTLIMYHPTTSFNQSIILMLGIVFMTFGRSLYISARLGQGPRDGVFVGLARLSGIQVKYIKPAIEFTVLIVGILLGGIFGLGTIIAVVISGYFVQVFMTLLKYDPKLSHQSTLTDYLKKRTKH